MLDSYAILTYLQNEAGADRVKTILQAAQAGTDEAYLPAINLGEIIYIVERKRGLEEAQKTLSALRQLPIIMLPADEESILAAAHIKAQYSISYADAFVVASAQKLGAVILTGDPEFESVAGLVEIERLP